MSCGCRNKPSNFRLFLSNNSFIIVIIIIIIIPKRGGLEAGVHFVFDQDLGPAEGRLWREKREKRGERGEQREERREKRGGGKSVCIQPA